MNKKLKNQLWRIPLLATAASAVFYIITYLVSGAPENSAIILYWEGLGNRFPLLLKIIDNSIELPKIMRAYDISSVFLMTMVIVLFFQIIETISRSEHFINILHLKFRSVLMIFASTVFVLVMGLIAAALTLCFLFLYDFLQGLFGKTHKAFFIPMFIMISAAIGTGIGSALQSGPTIGFLVMMFCIVIFLIFGFIANSSRQINKQNTKKIYKWLAGE